MNWYHAEDDEGLTISSTECNSLEVEVSNLIDIIYLNIENMNKRNKGHCELIVN